MSNKRNMLTQTTPSLMNTAPINLFRSKPINKHQNDKRNVVEIGQGDDVVDKAPKPDVGKVEIDSNQAPKLDVGGQVDEKPPNKAS